MAALLVMPVPLLQAAWGFDLLDTNTKRVFNDTVVLTTNRRAYTFIDTIKYEAWALTQHIFTGLYT